MRRQLCPHGGARGRVGSRTCGFVSDRACAICEKTRTEWRWPYVIGSERASGQPCHRADRAVASRAHSHSSHARHADTAHSMAPLLYITPRHTARLTRHSPHNVPSLGHTPSDHRCCCCCCSSSGVTVTSKTTTYVSHLDFSLLLRCVCFEQHDDHSK